MTTHRITVYSISERGVLPQFYHDCNSEKEANDWHEDFHNRCARAGVLIRVDRDVVGDRRER